jgi:hypothetical protein
MIMQHPMLDIFWNLSGTVKFFQTDVTHSKTNHLPNEIKIPLPGHHSG